MRVAIIGLGAIGGSVLEHLRREPLKGVTVVAACDLKSPAGELKKALQELSIPFVREIEALSSHKPDYVLEAASTEVAAGYVLYFLERGVSFIALSAGGLADPNLLAHITRLCRPAGPRLIVPSGAIGGLDIVRAAAMGSIERVHLKTTKPAKALETADGNGGPPAGTAAPVTLYRGTAAAAVSRFPRNINVAMVLALAGIGPERTTVEIIADPAASQNVHQIFLKGDFGEAEITLRNRPSLTNPRTSMLAVLSVLAVLKQLGGGVQPGA